MPYIVGQIDGIEKSYFVPSADIDSEVEDLEGLPYAWFAVLDPFSKMDENVELKVQVVQKSKSLAPEDMTLKLSFEDTYHNDKVLAFQGSFSPDDGDYTSIVNTALATEEFKEFELHVNRDVFADLITGPASFNAVNKAVRNEAWYSLDPDTDKEALTGQDLYDAIVEHEQRPNYLAMFFTGDLELFATMLRASETLNVPLKVELDPTLTPEQMAQIAEDLSAYSHRVEIIACGVVARPNSASSPRGKRVPRYALGTLLGYTILRNANTNAQGYAALQNPIAGHDFPMRWAGMEMRSDVKFNEDARILLAKAKVNVVLLEQFDSGPRFVLSDCLTQYDSKTSVLRLTSSAEISMVIDNRLIQICKRHLLKGKATFKADALRECQRYLEGCATAGWIVNSEDLGGKYTISITDRVDRPHDAVDLNAGYRPEGAVRAVYLKTSVHK